MPDFAPTPSASSSSGARSGALEAMRQAVMSRGGVTMRTALCAALVLVMAAPSPGLAQVVMRQQTQSPPAAGNGTAQAQPDRFARARDNYIALRDGRISVGDLSAEELQDVLDLDARVRGDYPDTRSTRERCVDKEVRRAGGRPSPLARQVIAMKCRN